MRSFAAKRGGECLSTEYVNSLTKLHWRCGTCGYEWRALQSVTKKAELWCPNCAGRAKGTIEQMRELADRHGGKCLSARYGGVAYKLRWNCKEGHEWRAKPQDIKTGAWCSKCRAAKKAELWKSRIEKARDLAKVRGGECLSTKISSSTDKLRFRCGSGHKWSALFGSLKTGSWCAKCSKRTKMTIDDMGGFAVKRGGVCLSTEYIDALHKLRWRCKEGHEWEASANRVKHGTWCQKCAMISNGLKRRRGDIEEMQAVASSRKGICLSTEYITGMHKLRWRCREGHEWEATPASVRRGAWCQKCAAKKNGASMRLSLGEMHELAAKHGGKCLSTEYVNAQTKLRWSCKDGHEWDATPMNVKLGTWCRVCWRPKNILTMEQMRAVAARKGGECLSTEYVNTLSNLRWRCKEGHEWEAPHRSIKNGQWCRVCHIRNKC